VSQAGAMHERAFRILQAAVEEAKDEPGVYVSRARVMQQSNISDLGEFLAAAEYLDRRGLISEGVNEYDFFVVTLEGIGEGARY
jgi:hypothetical protein